MGWWISGLCAVLVGACVWLIVVAGNEHEEWVKWCQGNGGHVDSHTDTTTTTTIVNGKPAVGVGTSTTYYCLSPDGRIWDIR